MKEAKGRISSGVDLLALLSLLKDKGILTHSDVNRVKTTADLFWILVKDGVIKEEDVLKYRELSLNQIKKKGINYEV